MLAERLTRWVENPSTADFDALAAEAFAFQYERIEPYRRMCDGLGVRPAGDLPWQVVPMVPTTAFKTVALATDPPREVFESSGTTDAEPSVHRHPYPDLYRAVIDATFPGAALAGLAHPPMLSLVPARDQAPRSSLAFMVDHILSRWAAPESVVAVGPRGVAAPKARGFLAARQRDRRPPLVLATAFALVELFDALERLGLRFRLPPGARVVETGGYKGRSRELSRAQLLGAIHASLGVPADAVVREYGMTELTSHFYAVPGDGDVFRPHAWTRVRILDPETLEETAAGATGLIAVFDLANLGSAVHLLTEDLGRATDDGFDLVGRAEGAELRGCSLLSEALSA